MVVINQYEMLKNDLSGVEQNPSVNAELIKQKKYEINAYEKYNNLPITPFFPSLEEMVKPKTKKKKVKK